MTLSREEGRRKISERLKGRSPSPEHRAALSKSLKGRKPDAKVMEARRAAGYGPEFKAKVSASKKGKKYPPRSPEFYKKCADARRGWKMTEEQKDKLRGPRGPRGPNIRTLRKLGLVPPPTDQPVPQ